MHHDSSAFGKANSQQIRMRSDDFMQVGFTVFNSRINYNQARQEELLTGQRLNLPQSFLSNLQNFTQNQTGFTLSGSYPLHRSFKRQMGLTLKEYADARRAVRLKTRLKSGDTVSRATYEAGYGSSSRVYERADAHLGMTPAAYRRGGQGTRIHSAVVPTIFGRLLVATTERGVCAVALGDDDATLERELVREYPNATIEHAGEPRAEWVAAIVRLIEGEAMEAPVPIAVVTLPVPFKVVSSVPFAL